MIGWRRQADAQQHSRSDRLDQCVLESVLQKQRMHHLIAHSRGIPFSLHPPFPHLVAPPAGVCSCDTFVEKDARAHRPPLSEVCLLVAPSHTSSPPSAPLPRPGTPQGGCSGMTVFMRVDNQVCCPPSVKLVPERTPCWIAIFYKGGQ